ncbi:protein phosphatase 2C domain-containing protein [Tsukamurella soli]|uniref:protein phosphatase 2C domain-containing protein n=1 Tax=Tsukamurella soli TaxID=644556 RepID=UPI003609EB6D
MIVPTAAAGPRVAQPGPSGPAPSAPGQVPPPQTAVRVPQGAPPAPVQGTIRIAPVVVGTPSPTVEPVPTDARFRTLPFRPDTVVDGWSSEFACVRGASLRGQFHRYNGAPRQDDMALHRLPSGRVVIAVADGVSSARFSHFGSTAVVRFVAQWIAARAAEVGAPVDWTALVKGAAWVLVEQAQAILGGDAPDPAATEKNLATTLVVAVLDPTETGELAVQVYGVGDSCAWVLADGTFHPLLGGKAADAAGLSSSAVSGLPRVPDTVAPVTTRIPAGVAFLVGTDGIGDPLGAGTGGVGDLLRAVLCPGPPSQLEFANALDFSRETFDDDRTLVAVWSTGESLPPSPAPQAQQTDSHNGAESTAVVEVDGRETGDTREQG